MPSTLIKNIKKIKEGFKEPLRDLPSPAAHQEIGKRIYDDTKELLSLALKLENLSLIEAVKNNNLKKVEKLVSQDVELLTSDKEGNTVLHIAAEVSNGMKMIQCLIENGAATCINAQNVQGDTPLQIAIRNHNTRIRDKRC